MQSVTLKFFGVNAFSLKALALALAALAVIPVVIGYASAQSIPLPPPFPSNSPQEEVIAENDRAAPKIEILTTDLNAGKNVFEVRITDDSSLRVREVKFVKDGQLATEGLFRDQNDVYKALIDIQPPARVVVVTAGDANGNVASAYKEYEIAGAQDVFAQIMDMLSQIPGYFQGLFSN